jgi:hypothetical protein
MSEAPRTWNLQAELAARDRGDDLDLVLPDPEDATLADHDFHHQIDAAWQVCDRFDLQTDIWRGRILRAVRDRERQRGEGRGTGFLNWLKERELSKSQAYNLMELADSADVLLQQDDLDPDTLRRFSKRAFVETAKAPVEVQQLVTTAAHQGDRITRQAVRQLADEWSAVTSDLLPESVRHKAHDHTIPARHIAPLVRELEKLPAPHQAALRDEVDAEPTVETVKEITAQARSLARYLDAAAHVQTLDANTLDLEAALEEALRLGTLNTAAELLDRAAQLEQAAAKTYTLWKRLRDLADRLYVDTGSSTPNLRRLLDDLTPLSGSRITVILTGRGDLQIALAVETSEGDGKDTRAGAGSGPQPSDSADA